MTKNVTLNSLKIVTLLLGFAWSVFGTNLALAEGIPNAAENGEFRDQAVKHAEQALEAGKQGDSEGMVKHIRASRQIAKEINSEVNGMKLQKSTGGLMKAWARAKKGDIEAATEQVEGSIGVLNSLSF